MQFRSNSEFRWVAHCGSTSDRILDHNNVLQLYIVCGWRLFLLPVMAVVVVVVLRFHTVRHLCCRSSSSNLIFLPASKQSPHHAPHDVHWNSDDEDPPDDGRPVPSGVQNR